MKRITVLATLTEDFAIQDAIHRYTERVSNKRYALDQYVNDCLDDKIPLLRLARPESDVFYTPKSYLFLEPTLHKLRQRAKQLHKSRNYTLLSLFVVNPHDRVNTKRGTIEDHLLELKDLPVPKLAKMFALREETVDFILKRHRTQTIEQPWKNRTGIARTNIVPDSTPPIIISDISNPDPLPEDVPLSSLGILNESEDDTVLPMTLEIKFTLDPVLEADLKEFSDLPKKFERQPRTKKRRRIEKKKD